MLENPFSGLAELMIVVLNDEIYFRDRGYKNNHIILLVYPEQVAVFRIAHTAGSVILNVTVMLT